MREVKYRTVRYFGETAGASLARANHFKRALTSDQLPIFDRRTIAMMVDASSAHGRCHVER
jgi:hypothetical protein